MTEDEARKWLEDEFAPDHFQWKKLNRFAELLLDENRRQNLISKGSEADLWVRHIVDSAQLVKLAQRQERRDGIWMDVGSGAGLPGVVAAILDPGAFLLVEPRKRRCEFLQSVVDELAMGDRVTVLCKKVQALNDSQPAAVISARAVASLEQLVDWCRPFSTAATLWLLPKGQNAATELAMVKPSIRRMFHVKQSATEDQAAILVGSGVGGKRQ